MSRIRRRVYRGRRRKEGEEKEEEEEEEEKKKKEEEEKRRKRREGWEGLGEGSTSRGVIRVQGEVICTVC